MAAALVAAALLAFAPAASATKTLHQRAHVFAELSGKARTVSASSSSPSTARRSSR